MRDDQLAKLQARLDILVTVLVTIAGVMLILFGMVRAGSACDDEWLGPGWDRRSLDKTIIQRPGGTFHIQREAPGTGQTYVSPTDHTPEAWKLYEQYLDRKERPYD